MVLLLHIKYVLIFPLNSRTATTNYLQFHQPTQVLANHWSRNGAPRPPTSHNPPLQGPAPSLTPSQHNARPRPRLRQVPARQVPAPATLSNHQPVASTPQPIVAAPAPLQRVVAAPAPQPVIVAPAQPVIVAPQPAIAVSRRDITPPFAPPRLVNGTPPEPIVDRPRPVPEEYFRPGGDARQHGSWPSRWRKFLEYAKLFALSDLLFKHGFPTSFDLKSQAGEALSTVWQLYHRTAIDSMHEVLNPQVCESFLSVLSNPRKLMLFSVDHYREDLRVMVSKYNNIFSMY